MRAFVISGTVRLQLGGRQFLIAWQGRLCNQALSEAHSAAQATNVNLVPHQPI
ncbi:hypothetical protein FOYG_10710 [Fusarium oxysporum NRRL 32931]|uniref:Uncharacterized protein n=1 Tax=Fusarium oxysporum NRRL 32931 TaxID=660029 RepID=W9HTV9_FUSOX|nr:hypothetical protein FOYG_10710 [Fusarium oxysporum NRRL 32931]